MNWIEKGLSGLYQRRVVRQVVRKVVGGPTYVVKRGGRQIYTSRLRPDDQDVRVRTRVRRQTRPQLVAY